MMLWEEGEDGRWVDGAEGFVVGVVFEDDALGG